MVKFEANGVTLVAPIATCGRFVHADPPSKRQAWDASLDTLYKVLHCALSSGFRLDPLLETPEAFRPPPARFWVLELESDDEWAETRTALTKNRGANDRGNRGSFMSEPSARP